MTPREVLIVVTTAVCSILLTALVMVVFWKPESPATVPSPSQATLNDRFLELQRREREILAKSLESTTLAIGNGQQSPEVSEKLKKAEAEVRTLKDNLRAFLEANPDLPKSPILAIDELGRKVDQQFRDVARALDEADPSLKHSPPPTPHEQFRQVAPGL